MSYVAPEGHKRRSRLTWHENTFILAVVALELHSARNIERRMAKIIFNEWRTRYNPKPESPLDVDYHRMNDPRCGIKAVFYQLLCDIGLDEESSEIACKVLSIR